MKILGLSGSLRAASFNAALLRAVGERLPEGAELTLYDYNDVPLYNGDLERPASVDRLIAAITAADAVVLATPEYNYSVPGVLKNALDWASRPAFRSCLAGKPVAVMSASPGFTGGVRAQAHLKAVLGGVLAVVFPYPEVVVARAGAVFTDGVLTDETTAGFVQAFADAFVPWVQGQKAS